MRSWSTPGSSATWLQRYQQHSFEGLKTRQGRGRRPILQAHTDLEAVRRAVQKNRQRVSLAKAELEQELGKVHPVFQEGKAKREIKTLRTVRSGDTMVIIMRPSARIVGGKSLLLFVTPTIVSADNSTVTMTVK